MRLETAMIFGDHMVIQREKPFQVWGTAEAGERITVHIQGNETTVYADEQGKWTAQLPPMPASFSETLEITGEYESLTYSDVAIGEVWLAGGQSNMEFFMRYDVDFEKEKSLPPNANIRFFDYPEVSYEGQLEDWDYSLFGIWLSCDSENLPYYSAVGYYFAREIEASLHIPVGIVGCNWGGTSSSAWMPEESVKKAGSIWMEEHEKRLEGLDCEQYLREARKNPANDKTDPFNEWNEAMLMGMPREQQIKVVEEQGHEEAFVGPADPWRPAGLYHMMLKKIIPYAIRGVIYYQGESDDPHADLYEAMLTELISSWRRQWGEEFPFLLVQLAPWERWLGIEAMDYPLLRQAQENAARKLNHVWAASIGDVGERYDIHPRRKAPVGKRLGLLARGHVYGEEILCDAPELEKARMVGNSVELQFAYVGEWKLTGDKIQALQVFADGKEIESGYEVALEENKIRILFQQIPEQPLKIAFARTSYYEVNLYNEAGIPVKPFEVTL